MRAETGLHHFSHHLILPSPHRCNLFKLQRILGTPGWLRDPNSPLPAATNAAAVYSSYHQTPSPLGSLQELRGTLKAHEDCKPAEQRRNSAPQGAAACNGGAAMRSHKAQLSSPARIKLNSQMSRAHTWPTGRRYDHHTLMSPRVGVPRRGRSGEASRQLTIPWGHDSKSFIPETTGVAVVATELNTRPKLSSSEALHRTK